MKKTILSCLATVSALPFLAQSPANNELVINTEEDAASITTIADIIRTEESGHIIPSSSSNHGNTETSHRSFVNVGFNIAKLVPKHEISLGYPYNQNLCPPFKNDWGLSLQLGHKYRLHSNPIAGMLYFNVDAIYADLNFNHYSTEGNPDDKIYSSNAQWDLISNGELSSYHYIPWCLEKYEVDFGMAAGPSITIAPFKNIGWLNDVSFNVFYHVGYHASLLWMQNDLSRDANTSATSADFNVVNDDAKINYAHGFMNSFGLNIDWKSIGIGVEKRYGYLNYKSLQKGIYGDNKYRFIDYLTRIYVSVKF